MSGKGSASNSGDIRDMGSFPGSGRSPGEGNGNPLRYSCLENPMDRRAWWATVHGITEESDMTEATSDAHMWGMVMWHVYMCVQLCLTLCDPMDCSPPGSSVSGIFRQEYWSGLPPPSPGNLPYPGIKPVSLTSSALAGRFFIAGATWEAQCGVRGHDIQVF